MDRLKKHVPHGIAAIAVLIAFFLIYRPTLFNFYIADDFQLMGWAYQAATNPKMVLEQYWTIHAPGVVVFYRPILYTYLYIGYKLWGSNMLCFRLVNILFELLSGLMLGLIVIALGKQTPGFSQKQITLWAFFSVTLFILFPLHSECVNWMTVVLNPMMTFFYLIALWSYIRWREGSKQRFLIASIVFSVLSLLTKENAVALPPTILAYEWIFLKGSAKNLTDFKSKHDWIHTLYLSIRKTFPYWLMLVIYFGLRKIILGDFIAGYSDYICRQSLNGWLHGLRDIFIPINRVLIDIGSPVAIIWSISVIALVLLAFIATLVINKTQNRIILFLILWFLLALLPNYKVFSALMNPGPGGRLAYLCTAPLCMFLTYGLVTFIERRRLSVFIQIFSLSIFVLSALILYTNNLAWAEAGHFSNKFIQELKLYYQSHKDSLTYIAGLPASSKHGILCLQALYWITQPPSFDRRLVNCIRIEDSDYVSVSSIKKAVSQGQSEITLLYWDSQSETLKTVLVPNNNFKFKTVYKGDGLREIVHVWPVPFSPQKTFHWLPNNTLEIISQGQVLNVLEISLPELPCWCVDFISVKLQSNNFKNLSVLDASLVYTNNIIGAHCNNCDLITSKINSTDVDQEVFFSLRNISNWSLGGICKSVKIVLPAVSRIQIKEIRLPASNTLVPSIDFPTYTGDYPGQVRLGTESLKMPYIKYNAQQLTEAKQVVLKAIQVAVVTEGIVQRLNAQKSFVFEKHFSDRCGQCALKKTEFPREPAIYKAWLTALDKTGSSVGFQSDDFYIRTDY